MGKRTFFVLLAALLLILSFLFRESFETDKVHFANDGPLGAISAEAARLPGTFTGFWMDLNWLGYEIPSAAPNFTVAFCLFSGPLLFAKFFPAVASLVLGLCAWLFFRQLRFSPMVCVLAAIAAALNMNFFSNACWGQTSRSLSLAATFLAMAALQSGVHDRRSWLKTILAGLAIGLGIMEGFDVGALFSICVAAFAVFLEWNQEKPAAARLTKGGLRVVVMAAFAAFIAAHTLLSLVNTQIKGVVGTQQDAETKQRRWSEATQWSTPKLELLRVVVPGLFGYRMDTPEGGQYWGRVGQAEGVPTSRFNGSGEHAGVIVTVIALFGLVQSFRKDRALPTAERKAVWFWGGLALISMLLAFGRYAPFYQVFYAIPYASTIRNPMKFMHLFHLALLVLFGYGLQALWLLYVNSGGHHRNGMIAQIKAWWAKAPGFDRKWVWTMGLALGAGALSWLIYSSSKPQLEKFIQSIGYADATLASMTAAFSIREVGIAVLFLAISVVLIIAMMSGWFSGKRAVWAAFLIGGLIVVDLGRSNAYWILHWDYKYKYATNDIIDVLRKKPHEDRVTMLNVGVPQLSDLQQLHNIEWHQHHFQYYNVQSLDVIQQPRIGSDDFNFKMALGNAQGLARMWELTSTRYVLGLNGELIQAMNQQFSPRGKSFKLHTGFDIVPKQGVRPTQLQDLTALVNPNGRFALIENERALPRAKLFYNWQIATNDDTALKLVAAPEFDPHLSVIVTGTSLPPSNANSVKNEGKVEFAGYKPKHVQLRADAAAPAVLLLNDKFNPNWKVTVDGKPAQLLRANYLMRGVYLEPGSHVVEFRFEPPITSLYISSAAVALGLLLCGYLVVGAARKREPSAVPE